MKYPQLVRAFLGVALVSFLLPMAQGALPADQRDWTWVHGAVFVPTNAVNEAQECFFFYC